MDLVPLYWYFSPDCIWRKCLRNHPTDFDDSNSFFLLSSLADMSRLTVCCTVFLCPHIIIIFQIRLTVTNQMIIMNGTFCQNLQLELDAVNLFIPPPLYQGLFILFVSPHILCFSCGWLLFVLPAIANFCTSNQLAKWRACLSPFTTS